MTAIGGLVARAYASQPLRFVLVGAFNTGFGYLVFALLYYLFSPFLHYLVVLAASAVINITIAYLCYKFVVFRTRGNYLREYFRFYGVYAVPVGLGVALLTFAIEVLKMNAYLAQALITLGMAVVSYFGHKHVSFRPDRVQKKDR